MEPIIGIKNNDQCAKKKREREREVSEKTMTRGIADFVESFIHCFANRKLEKPSRSCPIFSFYYATEFCLISNIGPTRTQISSRATNFNVSFRPDEVGLFFWGGKILFRSTNTFKVNNARESLKTLKRKWSIEGRMEKPIFQSSTEASMAVFFNTVLVVRLSKLTRRLPVAESLVEN